ncbi:MAG: hypothetical protein WA476_17515 [Acidobacteriaceae bacterium]
MSERLLAMVPTERAQSPERFPSSRSWWGLVARPAQAATMAVVATQGEEMPFLRRLTRALRWLLGGRVVAA